MIFFCFLFVSNFCPDRLFRFSVRRDAHFCLSRPFGFSTYRAVFFVLFFIIFWQSISWLHQSSQVVRVYRLSKVARVIALLYSSELSLTGSWPPWEVLPPWRALKKRGLPLLKCVRWYDTHARQMLVPHAILCKWPPSSGWSLRLWHHHSSGIYKGGVMILNLRLLHNSFTNLPHYL